jgi:hypothetical protein
MDINRFDAWTRRRFGRAAAGGLAALVAALPSIAVGAKGKAAKRRRKKRHCLSQEDRVWCGGRCVAGECCPGAGCGDAPSCQCLRSIGGPTVCVRHVLTTCVEGCADAAVCARDERCVRLDQPCAGLTSLCLPACGAE